MFDFRRLILAFVQLESPARTDSDRALDLRIREEILRGREMDLDAKAEELMSVNEALGRCQRELLQLAANLAEPEELVEARVRQRTETLESDIIQVQAEREKLREVAKLLREKENTLNAREKGLEMWSARYICSPETNFSEPKASKQRQTSDSDSPSGKARRAGLRALVESLSLRYEKLLRQNAVLRSLVRSNRQAVEVLARQRTESQPENRTA